MDLNPLFTGVTSFRPALSGGELKLFEHAGIKLVHGWLVDPSSTEYPAVSNLEDYDTAVNLIAEADHITKGQLVPDAQASSHSQAGFTLTPQEADKVKDGGFQRSVDLYKYLRSIISIRRSILPRQHLITTDILWLIFHCVCPGTRRAGRPLS